MKVILLKDVPKIGRKYEVKEISDGHARNFLFPRGLAEQATPERISALKKRMENDSARRDADAKALSEKIAGLNGVTITMSAKADERGHLFKKLRVDDIVHAIELSNGVKLSTDHINLEAPLSTVGNHTVAVSENGTKAEVVVSVVAEK